MQSPGRFGAPVRGTARESPAFYLIGGARSLDARSPWPRRPASSLRRQHRLESLAADAHAGGRIDQVVERLAVERHAARAAPRACAARFRPARAPVTPDRAAATP